MARSNDLNADSKRSPRWALITGAALIWALAPSQAGAQAQCPNPPPVTLSPQVPTDVCIPSDFPPNVSGIAFFDDFSWRSFVAMVWPALQGQRGAADPSQKVGATAGPLVFETFKADWELFQPKGAAPSPWNSYAAGSNPCGLASVGPADFLLTSFSKFANLGQAGFGKLVGPLVAQNRTYVRYLIGYNQIEFNQIMQPPGRPTAPWYIRANLKNVSFPTGALDVKSAWIDMTNIANPGHYYTRPAWVFDLQANTCSQKTVGLVGLHIVQKTPTRPQWIWSTFEQIDNVPPYGQTGGGPYAFNDGTGTAMPNSNPYSYPPPAATPAPFNVQRLMPIDPSTQNTNSAYQAALQGTVWQYYQLVMTQWPSPGNTPRNPGTPNHTIPGTIPGFATHTGFANTTLETFDQANLQTGCLACHTLAQSTTDFLWSLEVNAYPPTVSVGAPATGARARAATRVPPPLEKLKRLMQGATK
jgi:hypothetical protein